MKKFLLAFLLVLIIPLASAQCITVDLARSNYLSGETFQAEITGNISKALTENSIFFYSNGKEYSPAFNLVQISSNKWTVYFDIAKTYGDNVFSVKALCSDGILHDEKVDVPFTVRKTYDDFYNSALSQIDGKWNYLDVEKNSLAMIAFSYDPRLLNDGKNSLISKSFQEKCFPSACNVKDTSLALMALRKSNYSTDKIKNWLLDSENNVNMGLWDMIVSSSAPQTCVLSMNSVPNDITLKSGANQIPLDLPDESSISISLNCSVSSAKISHTLLGDVNDFPMTSQNGIYSMTLNNEKCWGVSYRSECDARSTAYAIMALKQIGENPDSEWFNQNAESMEEKALSYLFENSALSDFIINNQAQEGYWPKESLAISTTPDLDATVAVLRNDLSSKQRGEEWLFNYLQSSSNLRELLLGLQIFTYDRIEPLLSFSQGFFKVSSESTQTLTLANKGIFAINATISIDSTTLEVGLSPKERKEVKLTIPSASSTQFISIEVDYENPYGVERSYSIPMIIYPKTYSQQQINTLSDNPTETSFIESKVSFLESSLNSTLPVSSKPELTLNIRNSGTSPSNVTLSVSGLFGVIDKIVPSELNVLPNETKPIKVVFNTQNAFGEYHGMITAETKSSSSSIPVYILISSEVSANQTSAEPSTKTTSRLNMKYLGWGMVVLAILIAASFFYFKLRKKEKPALMQALEKLKKEQ